MFLIRRSCTRLTCKTGRSSYTRLTQLIPNMAKSITGNVMASLKPRWSWAWDNTTCGRISVGDDKDKGSIFSQMPPVECSIEVAEPRQLRQCEYMYRIFLCHAFACWPILPLRFECFVPMLLISSTYFVRSFGLPLPVFYSTIGLRGPYINTCHCRFGSATGLCARCGPDIEYRITSRDTAPYTCPDVLGSHHSAENLSLASQNYSDPKYSGSNYSVAQYGSVLRYEGRQCGYDAWFELATPFLSLKFQTQKKAN